ncbi:hypothetical protein [Yinghuangia soli]|uniref:Uncharacterized protein n=1 Tax=Yinghuangia soli TaxID=2908204 RepID=A0AA41U765_9ACTN|nr:hypothetical protein [Yinghuangia soli]MCF2531659.1 hypothetical protein [Yinghuangia soli]
MRYLAESFILSALGRGKSVEQFLGPVGTLDRPGVGYVEVRPAGHGYEAWLHRAIDADGATWDLTSLPPLAAEGNAGEEDFGLHLLTATDPLDAVAAAEARTGAVRARWVNETKAGDEYRDYVLAGRPATAPDGAPWPSPSTPGYQASTA